MLGTIVNALAIIIGGLVGYFLKNIFKERYTETILHAMGISVIVIGIMSAVEMTKPLLVILSLVIGSLIGELIGIERRLEKFALNVQRRFSKASNFAEGFVTTSLIYCVGAMAIYGSIESGLNNDHTTLYIKSVLDGVTAIVFAASLGIGVVFSSIPVFIYQGTITILSSFLSSVLVEEAVINMSSVGGILIIGIGINILKIKEIRIANMIPAVFIPVIYFIFFG